MITLPKIADHSTPGLQLHLLGTPHITVDNQSVALRQRKHVALLAYLVVTAEPHRRELLATLFWPDQAADRAFAALRQAIWLLRQTLGHAWLETDGELVGLANGLSLWSDVAAFRRLLAAGDNASRLARLQEAVALYRGPFLAGLTISDSLAFSEWHYFQEQTLAQEHAQALEELIGLFVAGEDWATAVTHARRWIEVDNLNEAAHRRLMELYAATGQRAAALHQYDLCQRLLARELRIEPTARTVALYEAIKAQGSGGADVKSSRLPRPSAALPAHNLPVTPTPFIGRQAERDEIKRLFTGESDCRLLTLVGPGGIGKTRLALQVANDLLPAFTEGACFIQLAHTSESKLLVSTIAEALYLSLHGGVPAEEQLLAYLQPRRMLLVLDNFEHLTAGAGLLATIVRRATAVKLIVTSRERLHLQEEWVVEVQGMRFPGEESGRALADLQTYSAVALFCQQARRHWADFALTPEEIPHLLHICRLVEGNPLGLELAAAWVRLMPCREIAQEIERNLDFLSTSLQNLPERHRSLRAVFEYSWQFLNEAEQTILRQLAVFRGAFSRQAAEAIVGASPSVLLLLVDKSLLRRSREGLYELHGLVRQYAVEKLEAVPSESYQVQMGHSDYYAQLMQQCEHDLKSARQKEALAVVVSHLDNILAGWRWAVANRRLTAVAQYLPGLWQFTEMRGWFQAGETLFKQAVASLRRPDWAGGGETAVEPAAQTIDRLLAQLLARQGCAAWRMGYWAQGRSLLQESLAMLQPYAPDSRREMAFSLLWLGASHLEQAGVRQPLEESLALFTQTGDDWGAGVAEQGLGLVAEYESNYQLAEMHQRQAMRRLSQTGDRRVLAFSTNALGRIAQGRGEYGQAVRYLEEGLRVRQEFGDRVGMAQSLLALGITAVMQGNQAAADRYLNESLTLGQEIHNRTAMANALTYLGLVARLGGQYSQARALHEKSLALAIGHQKTEALVHLHLGCLAGDLGQMQEALDHFQRSADISQALGFANDVAYAWGYQALVYARQNEAGWPKARQQLKQALAVGSSTQAHPLLLLALLGLALLAGQLWAAEVPGWLALAAWHPASPHEVRQKAQALVPGGGAQVLPDLTAAVAQAIWL